MQAWNAIDEVIAWTASYIGRNYNSGGNVLSPTLDGSNVPSSGDNLGWAAPYESMEILHANLWAQRRRGGPLHQRECLYFAFRFPGLLFDLYVGVDSILAAAVIGSAFADRFCKL
jgi:hypothetical protein